MYDAFRPSAISKIAMNRLSISLGAALQTSKLSEAIQTRAIRPIIAGKIDPKP
jgi:hypothetical protein